MPLLPADIVLAVVSAGLVSLIPVSCRFVYLPCLQGAHQVFKRFEPDNLAAQLALLILPPTLLSVVLHLHAPLLAAILYAFGIYLSTLVLSVVVYRLSPFHPLASYPGPLYLKVSKLSLIWIASRGAQHKFIKQLHERYGDVVRTGLRFFFGLWLRHRFLTMKPRAKRGLNSGRGRTALCQYHPQGSP